MLLFALGRPNITDSKRTPLNFANRGGYGKSGSWCCTKALTSLKWGKIGQEYCWGPIGSRLHAFDWCQNQRPRMTLKSHYALCFKTREPWCSYLFIFSFSFTFNLLLGNKITAGAITAVTFQNLKQITESMGIGKTRCIMWFRFGSMILMYFVRISWFISLLERVRV